MFAKGMPSISLEKLGLTEADLLHKYLGIKQIPCLISNPWRKDNHPSLGLFINNKTNKINFQDFSTQEKGNTFELLKKVFNLNYNELYNKIVNDEISHVELKKGIRGKTKVRTSAILIQVVDRLWENWDIEYWNQFGINTRLLEACNVHPINLIILSGNDFRTTMKAEKYAYAYVEFKEGKQTIKVYQPFSKVHKWLSNHDKSVVSLWSKTPKSGDIIIICSSVKDALTIIANLNIPAIAPQGEGYKFSKTAIKELKRRFKNIYVLYDNDKAGIEDAKKLVADTGFIYLELPKIKDCKDVAELRATIDKNSFINIIKTLLKNYGTKKDLDY